MAKLASGGMGDIYLARAEGASGPPTLAVKRLRPALVADPTFAQMFLDEARIGALLNHPNIAKVLAVGREPERYVMVMELVDGVHLARTMGLALRRGVPPELSLCVHIAREVAEGLHAAHEQRHPATGEWLRLVHRDVSPQNILLSFTGEVKLVDFGVARASTNAAQTRGGQLKGKLGYLAPEQCLGEAVDRRTDIFSLGIVLYELLTRARLFESGGDFAVMHRIVHAELLPPSRRNPAVDPALDAIVLRALAKDPADRFATAAELSRALATWLAAGQHRAGPEVLAAWLGAHLGDQRPALIARPAGLELRGQLMDLADSGELEGAIQRARDLEPPTIDETYDVPTAVLETPTSATALERPRSNFVPLSRSFVGRESELEQLDRWLGASQRVVTIVGPGGAGKTSLALRYLELHAGRWHERDGEVWVIDLTEVSDADGACRAVSSIIGVGAEGGVAATLERIGDALSGRGPVLMLFDNFEGLAASASEILGVWLSRAPQTQFLITSREPTGLDEERALELGPLGLPSSSKDLMGSEAAQLFLHRVAAVRQGFELTPAEAAVVAEIVRRLDGIPLAIELAAARAGTMSLRALLDRLQDRFEVLTGGSADHSGRHATMRATLDWSWALLSPAEQRVLTACAASHGSIGADAAAAVAETADLPRAQVGAVLESLAGKALLRRVTGSGDSANRFALYEIVREYALAKLSAAEARALRRQSARWYGPLALGFAARAESGEALERIRTDLSLEADNFLGLLRAAADAGDIELTREVLPIASALAREIGPVMSVGPILSALDRMLSVEHLDLLANDAPLPAARALLLRARMRHLAGRLSEARADLAKVLKLATLAGDARIPAGVHLTLGEIRRVEGKLTEAERHLRMSVDLAEQCQDLRTAAGALVFLGNCFADRRDHPRALTCYGRARAIARRGRFHDLEGLALGSLGTVAIDMGELDASERSLRVAIAIHARLGDRMFEGFGSGMLGVVRYLRGDVDEAMQRFHNAREQLLAFGELRFAGIYSAAEAAVLTKLDRIDEAASLFEHARTIIERSGDLQFITAARLLTGVLDIGRARAAFRAGDPESARTFLEGARELIDRSVRTLGESPEGTLLASSQAVRFAMMVVQLELAGAPPV